MALDDLRHPDAERLAEYAEGTLEVAARAEVERHLADCAACRAVVMETVAFLEMHPAEQASAASVIPFRSRRSLTGVAAALAVAAGLVLAVFVARPEWLSGARGGRPELQELIAAVANEPTRPVEGRLSGGFTYAPPPSTTRGPGDRAISAEVRIAAQKVESVRSESAAPVGDAASGVAHLVIGKVDEAIDDLLEATAAAPADAAYQNDLAAAYLARGGRDGRPDDFAKALAAANRAIELSPTLLEPRFNRALAISAMGGEARPEWRWYAERDPDSPWGREAQQRTAREP